MVVTVINSLEEFNDIVGPFRLLTAAKFEQKTKNTKKIRGPSPVVIEFCAKWCLPCQKINPIFDKCSGQLHYYGLSFYRVDIDDPPNIAQVADVQKVRTRLQAFGHRLTVVFFFFFFFFM